MSPSVSSGRDLRVVDVGAILDRASRPHRSGPGPAAGKPLLMPVQAPPGWVMLAVLVVGRPCALTSERVRVTGVPVPGALANWVIRGLDPTPRLASRPRVPVEIGRVSVGDGARRISHERP